jgi:hypothetical protein
VRAVLERIAEDETDHAELAWLFVKWAIAEGGEEVCRAVRGALRRTSLPPERGLAASPRREHGRLDPAEHLAVERSAWSDVILPCARALAAV